MLLWQLSLLWNSGALKGIGGWWGRPSVAFFCGGKVLRERERERASTGMLSGHLPLFTVRRHEYLDKTDIQSPGGLISEIRRNILLLNQFSLLFLQRAKTV